MGANWNNLEEERMRKSRRKVRERVRERAKEKAREKSEKKPKGSRERVLLLPRESPTAL